MTCVLGLEGIEPLPVATSNGRAGAMCVKRRAVDSRTFYRSGLVFDLWRTTIAARNAA